MYVCVWGFLGSSASKESTFIEGDPRLTPGSGISPGEGIGYSHQYSWASLVAQMVKNLPAMQKTWFQSLGWEDPQEEGMPTHSSILFFFFLFLYFTLQYCIGFATHQYQYTMGVHEFPSWTLLPPPSPYHLSGSSQCTSPKHPVCCIEPRLAIRFLHDLIYVSMPFSQYSCLQNPHGQRSLAGHSPWGHKESDTTEQLSTAQHVCV